MVERKRKDEMGLTPYFFFDMAIKDVGDIRAELYYALYGIGFDRTNYTKRMRYSEKHSTYYLKAKSDFKSRYKEGKSLMDKSLAGLIADQSSLVKRIRLAIKKDFYINIPPGKTKFSELLSWYYETVDNIVLSYLPVIGEAPESKSIETVYLAELDTPAQNQQNAIESFKMALLSHRRVLISLPQACDSKFMISMISNDWFFREILRTGAIEIGASGEYAKMKPSEYIASVPDHFIFSSCDALNHDIELRKKFQSAVWEGKKTLKAMSFGEEVDLSDHLMTIRFLDEVFTPESYSVGLYEDFISFSATVKKEMKLNSNSCHIQKDRSKWIREHPSETALANYIYNLYFAKLCRATVLNFRIPDDSDPYYKAIRDHATRV
jgi:hypothetical protein